ncbi:MAG: hypothetical protein Q8M31_09130 [Beijerinckiaceae bacterium]|nr:hypothetical protein [Beijerinckiaceae bacterium]
MRLMSYIRRHPKTGVYWYRRSVPERLRGLLPVVDGFQDKSGRVEFTRTLKTKDEREANRQAATLVLAVQRAIDIAEKKLAARPSVPEGATLEPGAIFAGIERWRLSPFWKQRKTTLTVLIR